MAGLDTAFHSPETASYLRVEERVETDGRNQRTVESPLVRGSACDFGLVEVLELVANDLPVAHGVDEPESSRRDFARFLRRVDQSIERADSALPEIFQLAPLFRDVETLRASEILGRSFVSGAPTSYHSRTASIPRRVVTPPRFGTTHSTSSARTSSTAPRSKFDARQRLTTSIASLLTPRAYVLCRLRVASPRDSRAICESRSGNWRREAEIAPTRSRRPGVPELEGASACSSTAVA